MLKKTPKSGDSGALIVYRMRGLFERFGSLGIPIEVYYKQRIHDETCILCEHRCSVANEIDGVEAVQEGCVAGIVRCLEECGEGRKNTKQGAAGYKARCDECATILTGAV